MLTFLRKHQKIFFLVITIVTISSFVFFGTYQAFAPRYHAEDPVIFKTIEGKEITKSTFTRLSHFLSQESSLPTEICFLNDGIITKELLETGLAANLYCHFKKEIDEDLAKRSEKEKSFQPYVHPEARFVSAEKMWSLFSKELPGKLAAVQKGAVTGEEGFRSRVDLYLAEKQFPSPLLVYLLRSQEEQYKLKNDPRLSRGDLSLFGYKNLEDWFGPHFMQAATSFILNGAAIAREKGYKVSHEEVVWDIQERVMNAFKAFSKERRIASPKQLFTYTLNRLGVTEDELGEMWEDLLLFRRLMEDVGSTAMADTFALREFYSVAQESVDLEVCEIPEAFSLRTIEDLKRFELYLQKVSSEKRGLTALPHHLDSLEAIEKRAEDLVRTPLVLEVASMTKNETEAKVSLKEIWAEEIREENWEKVTHLFPELASQKPKDDGARDEILSHLPEMDRELVDKSIAIEIAAKHPEWISEMLKEKKMEEKRFSLSKSGRGLVFEGISDPKALATLLEKENEINGYSQDGIHYFHIVVKERAEKKELLTYGDALKEGILDEWLKKEEKNLLVQPLVAALVEEGRALGLTLDESVPQEQLASRLRFAAFLSQYKENEGSDMPWAPVKKAVTVIRSKPSLFAFEEVASYEKGAQSSVKLTVNGPCTFRLLDKKKESHVPMDKLYQAQEMLAQDAKKLFFENSLSLMIEKKAMGFVSREM